LHPMRSLTSLYYKAVFSEHKGSQNIYLKINETKWPSPTSVWTTEINHGLSLRPNITFPLFSY
jgi:hypothetical protein